MNEFTSIMGYIFLGCIGITGIIITRLWFRKDDYTNYDDNRFLGLSDMLETLEKEKAQLILDKEALEMEIDKQESERRIIEKANEEIGQERDEWKGKEHLAMAKKAELELENSSLRILKIAMQNEIEGLRESIKADGKALVEAADANETLRRRNIQLEEKEKSNSARINELEMLYADLDEMTRKALMEKQDVKVSL